MPTCQPHDPPRDRDLRVGNPAFLRGRFLGSWKVTTDTRSSPPCSRSATVGFRARLAPCGSPGRPAVGAARRRARCRRGRRRLGAARLRREGRRPGGRLGRAGCYSPDRTASPGAAPSRPPTSVWCRPAREPRRCRTTRGGTPLDAPSPTAFDHAAIVAAGPRAAAGEALLHQPRLRLGAGSSRSRPSATSVRPPSGHPVYATNLQRVVTRRGMIGPTGGVASPGPTGGRPADALPLPVDAPRDRPLRRPQAARRGDPGRRTVERVAETVPLFPLGTVLMPGATLPLHIFEPRYRQLTVDLVTGAVPDREFGVIAVRGGLHARRRRAWRRCTASGCTAELRDVRRLPDGRYNVVTRGSAALPAARPRRRVEAVPHGVGGVPSRRRRPTTTAATRPPT